MKKLRKKINTRLGFILGFVLLTLTVLALPHLLAAAIGIQTALVFTSALVDQGSGQFGDMVLSHNRNGNYIKRYKQSQQPFTGDQAFYRAMLRGYAKAWKGTTVNRTAWIAAGALVKIISKMGATHTMTGFDLFVKYNAIAQQCQSDAALITTPPTVSTLFPILTGITPVANTGPDSITIQPIKIGDYVTGMKVQVWASQQKSQGVNAIPDMTIIGLFDPSPTTAIDVTSAYEAKYGILQVGQKIFFQMRLVMPTGESDVKIGASCLVTSTPA